MKHVFDALDGTKTYSAIAILATAGTLCPLLGVPAGVTACIVALGTVLGIVGRVHAGAKIADVQGELATVAKQIEVAVRYTRAHKDEK